MYQLVSAPQKRIILAIITSMAIIAGALFLRSNDTVTNTATIVNGEPILVTAAPKRTAIEIDDTNNDGVPDWQEALQVTEPLEVVSTSTAFLPPQTLTDQFALEFFEKMVRNENYGEFGQTPEDLINSTSDALAKKAYDTLIEPSALLVSDDNSPAALTAYGEAIARIILSHNDESNENEAVILERALRDQNEAELMKLASKADMYSKLLKETLTLKTPSSTQNEHLVLVNAYQALLSDITAMKNAFSDPMLALLRMKRYQEDVIGLQESIANLYNKIDAAGVRWPKDSIVMNLISYVE